MLQAETVALEMIGEMRGLVARLAKCDRDLADQVRRSASSVALNIGEGQRREGRARAQFYRIAAGSASETRTALKVAVAWGHLAVEEATAADTLLDRVLAMLWRLTH